MTTRAGDEALHEARELRRACLHEFAHLAVARRFGACGFVRILRSGDRQARYAGCFQMHGELADDEWRIVALAGTLAELVDDEPTIDATEARARLESGRVALSPLDASLARGYGMRDVARCLAILRAVWALIVADADERCRRDFDGDGERKGSSA
jgi:hypothetical protein